jgi:L-ascorbate metabolism protein UlaG (beta-lactamase superfamily)
MTHAVHSSSIQDGNQMIYGGEPGGYILHLEGGRNVYFAGDTAVFSDMALYADLYRPELAFLPIGDFFTMGPEQATLAARLLNVKTVIPMHFATFPLLSGTPEAMQSLLEGTDVEVVALQPGHPVSWGA